MAVVNNSLQLRDAMTPVLKQIIKALDTTLTAMASVDRVASREFGSAQNAIRRASEEVERMGENLRQTNNQGSQSQRDFTREVANSSNEMDGLIGKAKALLATYLSFQGIKSLVNLSDEYAAINSRLNLINDGSQTLAELQEKIRQSANRTGSSYQAVSDSMTKMAMMAGNAFSSNDELIYFMEQMNKQLAITGVKGAQAESVMYNMTQAMSSGVLRGNDFFILSQNMGGYLQGLANYLNVSRAELKKMAEEGKITSDVMKAALYNMADDTNNQFSKIPYQWGNIWAITMNNIQSSMQGFLTRINEVLNSQTFLNFMTDMGTTIIRVMNMVASMFEVIAKAGKFIYDNWSIISPIFYAVAGAITALTLAQVIYNGVLAISSTATALHTAWMEMATGTTFAATAAQYGLNTAILACPITWIIAGIVALIAIFYGVIAVINKVAGTTISATGIITGTIMTAVALIWNVFAGLVNGLIQLLWNYFVTPALTAIEFWINAFNGGFNSFGDACKNLIGNIISWFLQLGTVVTRIIDAIFGTDWTSGLNNLSSKLQSWGKNDKAVTLAKQAPAPLGRMEYSASYKTGYDFGKGGVNKLQDAFKIATKQGMTESGFDSSTVSSLASNAADTSKSCKATADTLKEGINISDEDIELLKESARTQFVNRFTTMTPQVTANFGDVHETADVNGIMRVIGESVQNALESNLT